MRNDVPVLGFPEFSRLLNAQITNNLHIVSNTLIISSVSVLLRVKYT